VVEGKILKNIKKKLRKIWKLKKKLISLRYQNKRKDKRYKFNLDYGSKNFCYRFPNYGNSCGEN
jgi:hypothetical protein